MADTAPPDFAAIADLAPFGAATPPDAIPTPEAPGPDRVLRGAVTSSNPSRAAAFVTVAGTTQRYATGDALSERIVLTAIFSDRVTLDADGAVRTLALPDAPVTSDTEGDPASAPDAAPLTPLERLQAGIVAAIPRGAMRAARLGTTQDHLQFRRDRIRRNPGQFLDEIGPVPSPEGHRLAQGHDSGFERVGLQAGDVVRRVNGRAVGDVKADRKFYDGILASGLPRVEIERDGETMSMSFPLH